MPGICSIFTVSITAGIFSIKIYILQLTVRTTASYGIRAVDSLPVCSRLRTEGFMDRFISDLIREYHVLFKNIFGIGGLILAWICITGFIRFCIAAWRRRKGVYPPAASMEDH